MSDNTLERAQTAFNGRVSRYTHHSELTSTVLYYLGPRVAGEMTGNERSRLTACLGSLLTAAMDEGARRAREECRLLDTAEVEAVAAALAKEKLAWLYNNFDEVGM